MRSILAPSVSLPSEQTPPNKVTNTKKRRPNPLPHTQIKHHYIRSHTCTHTATKAIVREAAYRVSLSVSMSNHLTHKHARTPFKQVHRKKKKKKKACIDVINAAAERKIHLSASCQSPALKMTLITNTRV